MSLNPTRPEARRISAYESMSSSRVEAFSDGVMAVLITIMVLDLHAPVRADIGSLQERFPNLLIYVLSFVFIGIYWNNHHHLFHRTDRISGAVMWANLHMLFWMSLIPIVTQWVGTYHRAQDHLPAAIYGVVCIGTALSFTLLTRAIVAANGRESDVAVAIGGDRKGYVSLGIYAVGIALSVLSPFPAFACYAVVSAIWLIPDRRMVRS